MGKRANQRLQRTALRAAAESRRSLARMMANYNRKQVSPDGKLTLIAYEVDGDYCIGFEGSAWHTHGDILVPEYGTTAEEATDAFFSSIVGDKEVIAIRTMPGEDPVIFVDDDPDTPDKYAPLEEKTIFRYWSGKEYQKRTSG
jgi:hypothetical protein